MSRILVGDCRDSMRALIADGVKVQMCVTSPPYWGLRDYGCEGQLGLEPTMEEFVANLVEVFRLVRELLADDGTLWLNLGDSYAGSGRGGNPTEASSTLEGGQESQQASMIKRQRGSTLPAGLHETARLAGSIGRAWVPAPIGFKQKDRMMIPARVAIALHADGWWLRDEIIWHKPNTMPSSVGDRTTPAHEMIYLLTKKARYYYDADAIKETSVTGDPRKPYAPGQVDARGNGHDRNGGTLRKVRSQAGWKTGEGAHGSIHADGREQEVTYAEIDASTRNKRSVWTVATQPYSEAHFATFPPKLIEPCILAGSRPGDIVFDPFFGSGTTGEVAQRLGREWIGCELNPEYGKLSETRTSGTVGMQFAEASA